MSLADYNVCVFVVCLFPDVNRHCMLSFRVFLGLLIPTLLSVSFLDDCHGGLLLTSDIFQPQEAQHAMLVLVSSSNIKHVLLRRFFLYLSL